MPRLKPYQFQVKNREIAARIDYYKRISGHTYDEIAEAAGITRQTLRHHSQHPDDFRLGELRRIASKLGTTSEALLGLSDDQKAKIS